MESFVFTNPNGEKLTFDYKGDLLITSYNGLSSADIEPITVKGYGQQGYTLETLSFGVRTIDLNYALRATSMEKKYKLRREVARILNPVLGLGTLTYTNDYLSKSISCYCSGLPARIENYGMLETFNITFNCPNPMWYDTAETAVVLNGWDGGFTMPFKFASDIEFAHKGNNRIITIDGDVESSIRVEFRCGESAIVTPRLINKTTGEYIQVLTSVGANEILTVTTEYGNKNVTRTLADGTTESAYHLIDINSTFFQLQKGVNKIYFDTESGDCDTYLYYRNYYTGV